MSLYKKLATAIVFGFLSVSVIHAKSSTIFPKGCEVTGFGYSNDFLILNEKGEQSYYLIQNHSNRQIELEHFEREPDVFNHLPDLF